MKHFRRVLLSLIVILCLVVRVRAEETPRIRYSASSPNARLDLYAKAVKVMQSRAKDDPTSWYFQAGMHGSTSLSPIPGSPAWSSCQHGSFFFLSWHRIYLYYFERIARAASGDDSFTLPYWNYSPDSSPQNRSLPEAFRLPADASNPLWVAQRRAGINNGDPMNAATVADDLAMAEKIFSLPPDKGNGFGGKPVTDRTHLSSPHGKLESQPHDQVHMAVGGWMGGVNTAALDPIFWLHHANIDRLWNVWIEMGDGRADPSDDIWLKTKFTFYDENKNAVEMTGAEVVNTAQQLGYRYDTDPESLASFRIPSKPQIQPAPQGAAAQVTIGSWDHPVVLNKASVTVNIVSAGPDATAKLSQTLAAEKPMELLLEDIRMEEPPPTGYEVFVNLPRGEAASITSPHYVGNMYFFGIMPHGQEAEHDASHRANQQIVETFDIPAKAVEGAKDLRVTIVAFDLVESQGKHASLAEETRSSTVRIGKIAVVTQ